MATGRSSNLIFVNQFNMKTKFYKCNICGNVVAKVVDSTVPVVCCGQPMELLVPQTEDAANEKHVPVVTKLAPNKYKIVVGSTPHPMVAAHHIAFVYLETENGNGALTYLPVDGAPEGVVCVCDDEDKPVAAYEYCNIHGLWKVDL